MEIKTIDDILNSKEFELIYDYEKEKKELEQQGWTYDMIDQVVKFILNNQNK